MALPPKAPIENYVNTYHGREYVDNYNWIRNINDPRVMEYIKQENAYSDEILRDIKPIQDLLYSEMKTRTKEDDQSVPEKIGDYYYYERTEKDKEYSIYCRKYGLLENSEEIYLNLNERTESYIDMADIDISPNHSLAAYSLDFIGDENYTLFIKDLNSKEEKTFVKENLGGFLCFSNDNKGLFFDVLNDVSVPAKVHFANDIFHSDESIELFNELDNTKSVSFYRSKDKKYFFITSDDKVSSEVYFINLEKTIATNSVKLFKKREENVIYQVYHNHGFFYILTNENNSKNFKIMRVEDEFYDQSSTWEEFLPHSDTRQISYLEMYDGFIVVHIRSNGIKNISVYDLMTESWHDINVFPEELHTINYIETPDNNEYFTKILRFNYSSLVTPSTVYDYDMAERSFEIKKVDVISNYSKDDYISKRLLVQSWDDVSIPISLFYKKEISEKKNNPLVLYGYGCYGIPSEPGFTPYILSLVERGFIYAIAHVRGGGEFGRSWYEQGKYENKINSFKDFISCIKFLIDNEYTNANKLAIRGGSAGGLLIGGVVNMVPDLINTAVMSVPFVDVVNTMMDPSIPLTTLEFLEFGNPIESKDIFEIISSYSPYDNLNKLQDKKIPNILVLTGINDSRVAYWEPVKYIAKLRSFKKDSNYLILKTNLQAGHGGASGRYEYLKELSLEYAFIQYNLLKNNRKL